MYTLPPIFVSAGGITNEKNYPFFLVTSRCCWDCNHGFSLDEVYFACFLECLIHGTTEIEKPTRSKIKETLIKTPPLHRKLSEALVLKDKKTHLKIDENAVENVLIKLAKGHIAYETSAPRLNKPTHLAYKPIKTMSEDDPGRYIL